MIRFWVLVLTASVMIAGPTSNAQAVESACAFVLYTSDGFVAVREKPSAASRMIDKLKGGQIVAVTAIPSIHGWVRLDMMFKAATGRLVRLKDLDGWVSDDLVRAILCD